MTTLLLVAASVSCFLTSYGWYGNCYCFSWDEPELSLCLAWEVIIGLGRTFSFTCMAGLDMLLSSCLEGVLTSDPSTASRTISVCRSYNLSMFFLSWRVVCLRSYPTFFCSKNGLSFVGDSIDFRELYVPCRGNIQFLSTDTDFCWDSSISSRSSSTYSTIVASITILPPLLL